VARNKNAKTIDQTLTELKFKSGHKPIREKNIEKTIPKLFSDDFFIN